MTANPPVISVPATTSTAASHRPLCINPCAMARFANVSPNAFAARSSQLNWRWARPWSILSWPCSLTPAAGRCAELIEESLLVTASDTCAHVITLSVDDIKETYSVGIALARFAFERGWDRRNHPFAGELGRCYKLLTAGIEAGDEPGQHPGRTRPARPGAPGQRALHAASYLARTARPVVAQLGRPPPGPRPARATARCPRLLCLGGAGPGFSRHAR